MVSVSEAIREEDQHFRTEIPMDIILEKLIEDSNTLIPPFNP
jgi:hypothetical protein